MEPINIGHILAGADGAFDDVTLAENLRKWESEVINALKRRHPGIEDTLKFSNKLPLDRLPVRERAMFMQRYRNLIGLDYVLNTMSESGLPAQSSMEFLESKGIIGGTADKISRMWGSLSEVRSMQSDNPYTRFPVAVEETSLINRIYSNINLQFRPKIVQDASGVIDPKKTPGGPSHYFTVGRSSIPTMDSLDQTRTAVPNLIGKKVTVFDIETAGLVQNQIREIAFSQFTGDEAGNLVGGATQQIGLRPAQFSRGIMYHAGENMDLEQFMHSKHKINVAGMRASNGDDFIKAVEPFLRVLDDSDYVVGHNIADFDIGQIFTGLAGTTKYKNERQFAEYIDQLHAKVKSSTIDTLQLARSNIHLQDLTLSEHLDPTFGKVFSIENLLMKTNLATVIGPKKLAESMGYDVTSGVFAKGLHHGDVDTLVTSALLNHMDELRIKSDMRQGFTGDTRKLMNGIHEQILSSAAITPTTHIRDRANIIPELLGQFDAGQKITPLDQLIYSQRNLGYGVKTNLSNFDLNPQAMSTRVRLFDRFKAFGADEMHKKLAANLTPFAGLSIEERALGTELSRITAGSVRIGRSAAELSSDALISHFELFDPSTVQYGTYSGRSSVPAQILEEMGLLSQDATKPTMLKLSAVDTTAYNDKKAINLVFGFESQEQVESLAARLQYLATDPTHFGTVMGMAEDQDNVIFNRFKRAVTETDMIKNLRETGFKKGVSIAQLYSDSDMVSKTFDLFGKHLIRDASKLTDEDMFNYSVGYAGIEGKNVRTAGIVLDKFMTDEDKFAYGKSIGQAKEVYERGYMGMMGNREARAFAEIVDRTAPEHIDRAMKLMSGYVTHVRPNVGKVGLAAFGTGAALLLYNRKRKQDKYDVAIEHMPAVNTNRYAIADQLQARMDAGYDGYRQQIDPLATASIVSNLHSTRLGHTNMGWDRNTNLYGGLL